MIWEPPTEADDGFPSKADALIALESIVGAGETMGVCAMYERAAWRAGATVAETEAVMKGWAPR